MILSTMVLIISILGNSIYEKVTDVNLKSRPLPENMIVTSDSFLTFQTRSSKSKQSSEVEEYRLSDGIQLPSFPLDEGYVVTNFGYIPSLDLLVILQYGKNNVDPKNPLRNLSGEPVYSMLLFGRSDHLPLGKVEFSDAKGERIYPYFDQLLTAGDELFFSLYQNPEKGSQMLYTASLQSYGTGYVFQLDGPAFDTRTSMEPLEDYSRRFVIKVEDTLLVTNQVQDVVKKFDFSRFSQKKAVLDESGVDALELKSWRPAFTRPPIGNKNYTNWINSFSQIRGFSIFERGFLSVYTVPRRNGDTYDFDLNFQKLDADLRPVGKLCSIPQGVYIGMHEDRPLLLIPNKDASNDLLYSVVSPVFD